MEDKTHVGSSEVPCGAALVRSYGPEHERRRVMQADVCLTASWCIMHTMGANNWIDAYWRSGNTWPNVVPRNLYRFKLRMLHPIVFRTTHQRLGPLQPTNHPTLGRKPAILIPTVINHPTHSLLAYVILRHSGHLQSHQQSAPPIYLYTYTYTTVRDPREQRKFGGQAS